MDTPRTLGQVIRTRRQQLGLTQEELAERIGGGVRQAEVSRLECDRIALPRRRRLERIAAALEMPLGELLVKTGWTGADIAFSTPMSGESRGPEVEFVVSGRIDRVIPREYRSALTDLRQAIVRSQELHWNTLQLLRTSQELARRLTGEGDGERSAETARTST